MKATVDICKHSWHNTLLNTHWGKKSSSAERIHLPSFVLRVFTGFKTVYNVICTFKPPVPFLSILKLPSLFQSSNCLNWLNHSSCVSVPTAIYEYNNVGLLGMQCNQLCTKSYPCSVSPPCVAYALRLCLPQLEQTARNSYIKDDALLAVPCSYSRDNATATRLRIAGV